jgi:Carboxypeptidase regulatory-like domain/TonB dependent receptor-like, beta-barrel
MKRILSLLIIVAGSAVNLWGQTFTGSVSGRVFDEKEAIIQGAAVTLRSQDTGAERRTKTGSRGEYSFNSVLPGRYLIRAEAPGFSPIEQPAEITVASQLRADLTLRVAALSHVDPVNVAGEAGVLLNTETAEQGITVNSRRINALPSATRNPYDFASIAPGASSSYGPPTFFQRGIGIAVNGQRIVSGNYLLDGGQNVNVFLNTAGQLVPLDSVQEYRLQTNNYSAEFGRGAGFVANVVTRNGSNEFHGAVYEYLRNSRLAANTPENNAQGRTDTGEMLAPRPVFTRNQFGFSLGGPVIKNRAFFYAGFEPILVRSSGPTTFLVPTPELLALSSPGTQAIFQRFPIPSGLSTTNVQFRAVCPFGRTCSESELVTIPAYAGITRTGPIDAGAGAPQNRYLGTFRFDYNLSAKMQLFARYAIDDMDQFATVTQPYSSELDRQITHGHHNALINLTNVLSPHVALESRLMYARVRGPNYPDAPRSADFPGIFILQENATLPSGIEGLFYPQNIYQISQTISETRGAHNLRFGGQFVQIRDNYNDDFLKTGFLTLNSTQDLVNGNIAQFRIAVDPKGQSQAVPIPPPFGPPSFTRHFRANQYALFVHDIWRIAPKLSLSLGLRYENFGVLKSIEQEKALESNFAWGPGSNIYERIANGGFVRTIDLPGDLKGKLYRPDNNNFGPRLGLAYDVRGDGKLVIRAGAGVFYDSVNSQPYIYSYLNPPAFSTTTLRNLQLTPELLRDPYSIFPNAPVVLNASAARFIDPDLKSAYVISWNAGLERQITNEIAVGATYIGSSGSSLYSNDNINRLGSGQFLGRPGTRLNPNVAAVQIRSNLGHSSYHGLQLRADSRFLPKLGMQFGANYTWSHSIDNSSTVAGFEDDVLENGNLLSFVDAFNPKIDKGASAYDIRHRFVTSFVWEFPFARSSRARYRHLISGWGVSGILEYQTGQPFTLVDTNAPNFTSEQVRPTYTGGALPSYALRPVANQPNTFLYLPLNRVYTDAGQCIQTSAPLSCAPDVNGPFVGVLGRNVFRRPGTRNENAALFKHTPLPFREGMRLEFRAEFYNLFNHPNLELKPGSQDVAASSIAPGTPGVLVAKTGSRQIVLGVKLVF